MNPAPEVYAHDPHALLPLLESLLPASISLVGAILANPSSSSSATPASANNFSPPSTSPPLEMIFATFPRSADPSEEWMALVILPGAAGQLRLFHSLEASPSPSPDAVARAQAMLNQVVAHILRQNPGYRLGAVHELWAEPLRLAVVGGPHHTVCTTFLAPPGEGRVDVEGADTRGLVLDQGRPGDEVLFHEKSGYRALSFYAARLGFTSVLRPQSGPNDPTPLPVAWVITLADGSTGALYTMPQYRRRGLAKVVVADRLAKCEGMGMPSYCHVEVTNQASERMWEGMGWTRGHKCQWIYKTE